jgi:Domain of unknown function (DUF1772)
MWWAVIGAAEWVGGTVFMFSVINPQWSQDPPDSVRQFFLHTRFNEYIAHFFGPPFMTFRSFIPQLLAVILGWNLKRHRSYLLAALGCTSVIIAFTLLYIYPINDVLILALPGKNIKYNFIECFRLFKHGIVATVLDPV